MKTDRLLHMVAALILFVAPHDVHGAGARLLSDLNPGSVGSFPSNFTAFGPHVYFSAYTFETGIELWRTDGVTVSLAANINPTATDIGFGQFEGNDSVPDWLTIFDGQLYFAAFEPGRGAELWRFDGLQAFRVSDINVDANDSIKPMPRNAWPRELAVVNNVLYFSATSSTNPPNYELYSFDGSTVERVANIHPDIGPDHSSYPTGTYAFNDSLLFMADDGANGWELFRHNGTALKQLNINPGGPESSAYPKHFTPFNNQLFFQAYHSDSGFELWKTDGETAAIASDIFPGTESSYPDFLTAFNGAVYFRGVDPVHGSELLRYNGAEVSLAADIHPTGNAFPKFLTVLGKDLVFTADDGVNGWELWKFDGASATLVTNLNSEGDAFPDNFMVHNAALYFTAVTPATGFEIWKFDGSNVTLAADVNEGPGDSFPRALASANGRLFFSAASDGSSNWEPWVLDESATPDQNPRISVLARNGLNLEITASGSTGATLKLEDSDDLRTWALAGSQTVSGGTATFVQPVTGAMKFFRVVAD